MEIAQPKIDVNELNDKLETMPAIDRVAWAAETFGD